MMSSLPSGSRARCPQFLPSLVGLVGHPVMNAITGLSLNENELAVCHVDRWVLDMFLSDI